MYTILENYNYGASTTTYDKYVAISNPDSLLYSFSNPSLYHTGSVDYYIYNKGLDQHELVNTLYRPIDIIEIVLAAETGSDSTYRVPIHTELNNTLIPSNPFSLYNNVTGLNYNVLVIGTIGNETASLAPTGSTTSSIVQLYDSNTNSYYDLNVSGSLGHEYLVFTSIGSTKNPYYLTSPILYNTTSSLYYSLSISGSAGNESLQLSSTDRTLALRLEQGNCYDLDNSFGKSIDLYETNLIIGCPYYYQLSNYSNFIYYSSGSGAYIINLEVVNSTSSYDNIVAVLPSPTNITNSFGTSVAINQSWAAVGSPYENNGSGVVYMYQFINDIWNLYQTIYSPITKSLFGNSIKLNKDNNTPSDRLVVGCGNLAAEKVYYYELSASIWTLGYTFIPDNTQYPLTFNNYLPYSESRNSNTTSGSGFGYSVSTFGDVVVIGEYLDRSIYEFSGSSIYNQGSVSIYNRCNTSSSIYELVYKTYGNENTLQNNNLGYSVDIWNTNVVAGCPKSNQLNLSSSYIGNTIFQLHECDDSIDNSLSGQCVLIQGSENEWDILNVYQRKKQYLSPYRAVGNNVSVGSLSMVVGAPIIISDSNRVIQLQTTQSLDDICGKAFIYNFNNLQNTFHIGNSFYRNGKIVVMTSGSIFDSLFGQTNYSYNLNFAGQNTIYEKQVICNINPGEFNVSTNPTAIQTPISTFDLNQNGKFDFEDMDTLMRYMKYKLNQSLGLSYSTDWSSSILINDDEISLYNYYTSLPEWNNNYINQQVIQYIPIWDFQNTSIQLDLDLNGDNAIDIRDMNIMWKYFSNRLSGNNYNKYTTPNSIRQNLSQALAYLDGLSGKNNLPMINTNFFNYNQQVENDPTGSYLAPYITSVGLYDNNLQLVAIGKLGVPIKNGNNVPLNILMRIDF